MSQYYKTIQEYGFDKEGKVGLVDKKVFNQKWADRQLGKVLPHMRAKEAKAAAKYAARPLTQRMGIKSLKMARSFNDFALGTGAFTKLVTGGFLALGAYEGYKHGGITGAIGGFADSYISNAIWMTGFKMAGLALGNPLGIAATLGVGMAAYNFASDKAEQSGSSLTALAFNKPVREYMRKRARLEMGNVVQDQFGTVATMRQRSLLAMRNSKINARGALGMEANMRFSAY